MGIYPELDGLSLDELFERFHGPPPDGPQYAFTYYSEIAWLMRQFGEDAARFLLNQAGSADTARLRAALFGLASIELNDPCIRDVLICHLRDRSALIIAEAIDGLAHRGVREVADKVLAYRAHRSPFVRGAVLRYVSNVLPDTARPLLLEALNDPHYVVRENAVDELDSLGAVDAIPAIRPLLNDSHKHVREAATTAIENLESELTVA